MTSVFIFICKHLAVNKMHAYARPPPAKRWEIDVRGSCRTWNPLRPASSARKPFWGWWRHRSLRCWTSAPLPCNSLWAHAVIWPLERGGRVFEEKMGLEDSACCTMRSWDLDLLQERHTDYTWSITWLQLSKYYLIHVCILNIKILIIFLVW